MSDGENVRDATLLILQNIQASIGDLRKDVARVQTDLAVFRDELRDEFRSELGGLRSELRAEIQELRDELRVGFKATMKQNDRRFLDHEARIRALERRR